MNFTETFQDFSTRVGPTDLVLYAGVGLVLWVLFGDKLGGVKNLLGSLISKVNLKGVVPAVSASSNNDKFFQLLTSWKKTRDLAVENGCMEAVKVIDQMFPYLSPVVCGDKEKEKTV